MFYIKPKRAYCRKHGIEYSGYMCPECRMELEHIEKNKQSKKETNHNAKPPKLGSERDMNQFMSLEETSKAANKVAEKQRGSKSPISPTPPKSPDISTPPFRIPHWLFALLLIFSLSILGLGLNALTKSPIPFWLLLGFSIIFPIEKWFREVTLNKPIGKLYRLVLNLVLLSMLGLLVWSGFQLVARQLASTPLISSAVFLAELIFFIWVWRKVTKNSWRWPSMKLTMFLLVCIVIIFTFAGVPPLSTYKDNLVVKWEKYQAEQATQQAEIEVEIEAEQQRQQAELERVEAERLKAEQEAEAQRIEEERIAQGQVELARREAEVEKERLVTNEHFDTLFNEYRQSYGLNTLTFTDDLNKRAMLRLPELELDYSHNSSGDHNLHLAENITWASYTLDNNDAFLSWKGSPGHNANMLNVSYKYSGYAIGGGYAVQLFSEYPTIDGVPQLPQGWYWSD